eukprot:m51a1_g3245 hypothetical protein (200) ;mRNA; r:137695-138584
MRFRFCGDLDAPEWLLREIASLSRMTYVRIKLLSMHILNHLVGTIDALDFDKIHKLVSTASFDEGDVKGAIAALRSVLRKSAQYGVSPDVLSNELNQLGLPAEHCRAISRVYGANQEKLRSKLEEETLGLSRLSESHWRVDYVVSCGAVHAVNKPCAQLALRLSSGERVAFAVPSEKLRVLHAELCAAQAVMQSLLPPQ